MCSIQCCPPAIQANVVGIRWSITAVTDVISQVLGPGVSNVDLRGPSKAPLNQRLQAVIVRVELWREHGDRAITSERSDLIENVRRDTAGTAAEIGSSNLAGHGDHTGSLQR